MALLGNGFDDPQSAAIMALSAGLLGRNFAGGLMGANQAYAQGKEAQRRAAMDQMQLDMAKEDRALKRKAMEMDMAKKAEGQAFLRSLMGGGEPVYSPGQLGSGSFGVVPNAAAMEPAPRRAGGLANATPEQIAMAKVYGFDLTEPWKVAKQGFELKPNSYRVDPGTNRREYIPDVKEGITLDPSGRVVNMPGATDALMQRTLAAESAKALLNAAGRVNIRDMPDGTQAPVSELTENPTLQGVLGSILGGPQIPRGGAAAAAAPERVPVRSAGRGDPPAGSGLIQPQSSTDRMGILQSSLQQARAGLASPTLNDMDRARLAQDVKDLEAEMAGMQRVNGRPAPTATAQVTPSAQGRYGRTTAQKTQEAAKKEYAVGAAKDMVETRKSIMDAGRAASRTIAKYQQLGGLLEGFEGGALTPIGTNIASMANSLGLKIDKNLPNKEAAAALANEIALEMRNPANGAGMPGAMSDKDREFLVSLTPNSGQTAQGRRMIVNSAIAIAKRNEQVAEFARKYEQKYGQLDNDFFSQLSAWSAANPLFKGK